MILLISASAYSQDAMFKVLASKGSNKVVSGTEHKSVLIGQKLLSTDKIIVGENSYLGLAHKNGKTIELKKAGTYEVSKLSSEVAAQNAGVAKKYVDFVAGEMSSQDEDLAKNRHKYMAVTGSVERDVPLKDKEKITISLIAPSREAICLADQILLKWKPIEKAGTYIVTLYDIGEEPINTIETTENNVLIDLSKYNIQNEKSVLCKVSLKGKKEISSELYPLKYIEDPAKAASTEKEVAEVKAELKEETALNKIILASFYEEKGLILEALAAYESALKMEPEVEDYKVAYGKFLERTKLVPEHKK